MEEEAMKETNRGRTGERYVERDIPKWKEGKTTG